MMLIDILSESSDIRELFTVRTAHSLFSLSISLVMLILSLSFFLSFPSRVIFCQEDYVFEYVARFATAGEVRTHHPDCRNIKWTASLLDFEFVKIALNTIVKYAESSAAMEMFASCGAMPFFKQFLACENKSTRGWLDVQYVICPRFFVCLCVYSCIYVFV